MKKLTKLIAALAASASLGNAMAASYYLVAPIQVQASTPTISVNLLSASPFEAQVNKAYSFDLKSLLDIQGDSSLDKSLATWSSTGLPAGLSIVGGVLQGTPTAQTSSAGQDFQVVATYKTKQGQQVYTIKIGEQYLTVKQLEVGERHACAVTPANAVFCWGNNTEAQQLGTGSGTNSFVPVQVFGLASGVSSVAVGAYHSCALLDTGAVSCWGGNGFGQLGDGTTTTRSVPQSVVGLNGSVKKLSAGHYQTCAIMTDNTSKCWGYNGIDSPKTPRDIGLANVVSISAGAYHACAALSSGEAKCWGNSGLNRLGVAGAQSTLTPVSVTGLSSGVAKVSVGGLSSCALLTTGSVKCWGARGLGNSVNNESATPIDVPGISNAIDLSVNSHSCVLTASGQVKCWGEIWSVWNSATPQVINGFGEAVVGIASSNGSACATLQSGKVQCWGDNSSGKLGDGSTNNRTIPGYVLN